MSLALPIPDLLAALIGGGAVVLGLVIGGLLLGGRGAHPRSRRFLGGFLVAGALTLTNELVSTLGLQRLSDHFWITPLLYTYALGPLIYFFVRSRLAPNRGLRRADLWHALLPALQVIHQLGTGFATIEMKDAYWQSAFGQVYTRVDALIFVVSFGGYLVASHRLLRANSDGTDLHRWLRRLVLGCAAIVVVALVMETPLLAPGLSGAVGEGAFAWLELVEMMAYASLLYWVAFTGFVHGLPRERGAAPRVETYGMADEDVARLAARVEAYVAEARPYLDPQLTLGTLADQLCVGEKELSLALNEGLGQSYTDFVNGLRVAEARRRLSDPARVEATVLEIGLEAGFASKATFNRVFKRVSGTTPSAYRAAPGRLDPS